MNDFCEKYYNNQHCDYLNYNNEKIIKIQSLLSKHLSKQEHYIIIFKNSIMKIALEKKETQSKLNRTLDIFSELIKFLGISFCELIKKEKELLDTLFKLSFNDNMKFKCQEILLNIIEIYNYNSRRRNFGDIIKERFTEYFPNFRFSKKRNSATEIENLIDEINVLLSDLYEPKNKNEMDSFYFSLKEKEFKLNCLYAMDKYFPATLEYCLREINTIKNSIPICQNEIIQLNDYEKRINKNKNINDQNQKNLLSDKQMSDNIMLANEGMNLINRPYKEQMNLNQKKELKYRTFFFNKEKLFQGEDQFTEFKDYSHPLGSYQRDELIRQYLGFLNGKGGRIYLGITDLKEVVGMTLKYKDCDTFRSVLVGYTKDFYPDVRVDKIKVFFIPVKNPETGEFIPDLFVVKIVILPGEPNYLYTMGNSKKGLISAIRQQTEVFNLTIREIHEEIIKRNQSKKMSSDRYNNILNQYDDPEVITLEKVNSDEEEKKKNSKDGFNIKVVKKCEYILKIQNIDKTLKPRDINKQFHGCGCKIQRFKGKDGKNAGEGFLIFDNEKDVRYVMEKFEGTTLGGKNKITMKLVKSEYFLNKKKL